MMSQQNPRQRPNNQQRQRPQNNQPQQDYFQQGQPQHSNQPPQQQTQYPPQGRPMPPQAPPPNYAQPLPPQQQPSQPEKVYIERKQNPLISVMKVIAFPFVKILEVFGGALKIIFQELVRSIFNLIIGVTLLVIFVLIVGTYLYALYTTRDFSAAVPEMFEVFGNMFRVIPSPFARQIQ